MMNFSKKYLIIILLLSLILRIMYVVLFLDPQTYYWQDTIHYYTAAENLFNTGDFGLDAERNDGPFGLEPVYSIFLSCLIFFKNSFIFFRIIQSIIWVLSAYVFYELLKFFFNKTLSLLGVVLYSFYPFFFYFSGVILPESIYTPVLVCFTYFLIRFSKNKELKSWIIISVIIAILIHLKVTSVSLMALLLIPFLYFRYVRATYYFILSIGIILILSTPYAIRNYYAFDKLTLPRNYGVAVTGEESKSEFSKRFNTISENGSL